MKNTLAATIFVLLFSVVTFSQASLECSLLQNELDKQDCERRAEQRNRSFYHTRFTEPDEKLVPKDNSGWVLHLVTSGGISRKGLPTITIRSNGDYACGEAEPLQFERLENEKLNLLSELITSTDFKITDALTKTKSSSILFSCPDCYQTSILLARREANGKVKSYSNSSRLMKYSEIAKAFGSIEQNISNLAVCAK